MELGQYLIVNNIICNAKSGGDIFSDSLGLDLIAFNNVWNNLPGNYYGRDPNTYDIISDSSADSPCHDAGDPNYVPYPWQRDIDGGNYSGQIKVCCLTKQHSVMDVTLSSYPYVMGPAINADTIVWQNSNCSEIEGISPEFAYSGFDGSVQNLTTGKYYDYIQHAIIASQAGDTIVAGEGIYHESINFNGNTQIAESTATVTYSDVQGSWPGLGNIDADPLFANPDNSDYHLKSKAGRCDPGNQTWIEDDLTSPCIDKGDTGSPVADEPIPNGDNINMGAYGGTAQASMTLSD